MKASRRAELRGAARWKITRKINTKAETLNRCARLGVAWSSLEGNAFCPQPKSKENQSWVLAPNVSCVAPGSVNFTIKENTKRT